VGKICLANEFRPARCVGHTADKTAFFRFNFLIDGMNRQSTVTAKEISKCDKIVKALYSVHLVGAFSRKDYGPK
jgi:hypothetical protein